MTLNSMVPVLYVPDVAEAVRFYCDVLGFERREELEGWACVAQNDVELMLSLPNAHLPFERPHFTGSLYFKLDSAAQVDDLWRNLKDKVRVVYPIEDFEYGMREFGIYDNNAYVLNFGSEIFPIALRIHVYSRKTCPPWRIRGQETRSPAAMAIAGAGSNQI